MYTWEIEKTINENNGILDSKTYLEICETSPQINRVKYEAFGDYFRIWTIDRTEEFQFKVVLNKEAITINQVA